MRGDLGFKALRLVSHIIDNASFQRDSGANRIYDRELQLNNSLIQIRPAIIQK